MGLRGAKPMFSVTRLIGLMVAGAVLLLLILRTSTGGSSNESSAAAAMPPAGLRTAADVMKDVFYIQFVTTKGNFVMSVHRSWAPIGAARMEKMVKDKFFSLLPVAFFRNINKFMVQFGIPGSPRMAIKWSNLPIKDDIATGQSNTEGMVSFATSGPNTRTTQMFINFGNNKFLDKEGFTPFARIEGDGMAVIKALHVTGEGAPSGPGPNQGAIQQRGNAYLKKDFPEIDYITSATIVSFMA